MHFVRASFLHLYHYSPFISASSIPSPPTPIQASPNILARNTLAHLPSPASTHPQTHNLSTAHPVLSLALRASHHTATPTSHPIITAHVPSNPTRASPSAPLLTPTRPSFNHHLSRTLARCLIDEKKNQLHRPLTRLLALLIRPARKGPFGRALSQPFAPTPPTYGR